jgi:predicted nucleotide-binding protein
MEKFHGDEAEFRDLIGLTGMDGAWHQQPTCLRFRSKEGGGVNWAPTTGKVWYDGGPEAKASLRAAIEEASALKAGAPKPVANGKHTIFVVHGHDHQAREQLELVLMKLGLQPFVLQNTDGGGMTIIEQLEEKIGKNASANFGIVLLTPDDMGYAKKDGSAEVKPRARQNVILEMGMLLASLTRARVAILQKGHVEHPSDVAGIIYIPFNDHVKETVPKLVQRLQAVGFNIDPAAIARASA